MTGDIDVVIVTDVKIPQGKFSGPGFEFFKDINPGKIGPEVKGLGIGPGEVMIGGKGPGTISKEGLLDPFFREPGKVTPPSIRVK